MRVQIETCLTTLSETQKASQVSLFTLQRRIEGICVVNLMKNAGFSNPEPTHFFFMANAFGTLQITCSVVFPFLIFCIFVATSHHNHNSTFLHSPPSHIASHMLSCSQLHRASQIRPRWGMVNHEASRFDHPKKVILCDFHRFCNSNQEAHYSRLLSSVCIYCCVYSFVTGSSLAIALTGAKS